MRILLFISLLVSIGASAQDKPSYFIGLPGQTAHARGNLRVDSVFLNALKDTTFTPWRLGLQVFRTADSSLYISTSLLAANKWTKLGAAGAGGVWGAITGTIASQTDLMTLFNGKQDTITLGTTSHYIDGTLALRNFSSEVTALTDPLYSPLSHTHNGLAPVGGTAGQVLTKNSNTNYDYSWTTTGTGTVTNVATGLWLSGGPITSTGTIVADSSGMAGYLLRRKDSATLTNPVGYVTPTWLNNAVLNARNFANYDLTFTDNRYHEANNKFLGIYNMSGTELFTKGGGAFKIESYNSSNVLKGYFHLYNDLAELKATAGTSTNTFSLNGSSSIWELSGGGVVLDIGMDPVDSTIEVYGSNNNIQLTPASGKRLTIDNLPTGTTSDDVLLITSGNQVKRIAGSNFVHLADSNTVYVTPTWLNDAIAASAYTDADARAAISLTTTGTSGAATYNSGTGVLNIPQYSGAQNLSWDATNHEVDISGGGTSAVIPFATGSVNGLVSTTTQSYSGLKTYNTGIQSYSYVKALDPNGLTAVTLETEVSGPNYGGSLVLRSLNGNANNLLSAITLGANRTNRLPNISGTLANSVTVNGTNYTSDAAGIIDIGTISGGSGSGLNIYNSDSTLSANRRVYGQNDTRGLRFDSLNYFNIYRTAINRLYVNNLSSGFFSPDGLKSAQASDAVVQMNYDNNNVFRVYQDSSEATKRISYTQNLGSAFSIRSLVDKGYVDSSLLTVGGSYDSAYVRMIPYVVSGDTLGAIFVRKNTALANDTLAFNLGAVGGSMTYPGAGIALSTGSAWGTSITDNSANWNTAYTDRLKWDGGATGLTAATGRTSLGLDIGTNVQAYDADLTTYAGLTPTTIGSNVITLTNPSAVTFPRYNADNTVTARSATDLKTDLLLNNVDNTSDATKNSATAALTNKDLTGVGNTFPTFNQSTTGSAATLTTTRTIWGQNFNGSANVTGNLTLGGSDLLTPGSIGATGARATKVWATDAEFTNVPTVGGVAQPTASSTTTFTNKRITARTGTVASSATPTINTDNVDFYSLTAQAVDITSFTTNLSGTPTEGQKLWIAITGTAARAITWGASFEASTVALPTTTVTTNRLDVGFVWNTVTSKWRVVAVQ